MILYFTVEIMKNRYEDSMVKIISSMHYDYVSDDGRLRFCLFCSQGAKRMSVEMRWEWKKHHEGKMRGRREISLELWKHSTDDNEGRSR